MAQFVLLVDDNPDDILLAETAISMLGKNIRLGSVFTGEAALELLGQAEELPALILLDLKMPGIDGIETLQRVRADGRLRDIPVVIVTSSTLESDQRAAREAGASGYVCKDIDLMKFCRDLDGQLERWLH